MGLWREAWTMQARPVRPSEPPIPGTNPAMEGPGWRSPRRGCATRQQSSPTGERVRRAQLNQSKLVHVENRRKLRMQAVIKRGMLTPKCHLRVLKKTKHKPKKTADNFNLMSAEDQVLL